MKTLMIFLDGVGIAENSTGLIPKNSVLGNIIMNSLPIDACLGVEGLPQSGTGQTSLFCGVNSQKMISRHQYAYPDEKLKQIIKKHNLFSALKSQKKKVCFANAYTQNYIECDTRRRSVTTWMTLYSKTRPLIEKDLLENKAVYHDITNETYGGNIKIPIITPEKAGENLLNIASKNDFTLFEYFLTDRMGHGRESLKYLEVLNRFLNKIIEEISDDIVLLISSDHGNIEIEGRSHSRNPVPLFLKNYNLIKPVNNISQIKNLIIEITSL
ncbi:MAG: alkaline phosphatase family protein [Candidatus Muirbacterium halophilum]|nr:alkaline phosphatase family protein [Candidatus Muirbacterium halophilum]